jgi:hypothetical protein
LLSWLSLRLLLLQLLLLLEHPLPLLLQETTAESQTSLLANELSRRIALADSRLLIHRLLWLLLLIHRLLLQVAHLRLVGLLPLSSLLHILLRACGGGRVSTLHGHGVVAGMEAGAEGARSAAGKGVRDETALAVSKDAAGRRGGAQRRQGLLLQRGGSRRLWELLLLSRRGGLLAACGSDLQRGVDDVAAERKGFGGERAGKEKQRK